MQAEIISVGTELLLGDIVNTNAQFLARQLALLGFSVYHQTTVGDNAARLRQLVLEAKQRSDLLVFTGGLGPTDDDLTRETVTEAFGDTLVLDREELARIEEFFISRGRTMALGNRKQAMVPRAGHKLPNPNGTAPGAWLRQGGKYAVLLPGPPGEMRPMFENHVLPLLQTLQQSTIRSVVLRVFGVGESELEDQVRPLLEGANPTAALYAKTGEVHIRITAKAPTAEQAEVMCDEYAALFHKQLREKIYSDNGDDMETVLVKQLLAENATLATAESCTGGLLAQRITAVPGASGVFGYGAVTYANRAKRHMLHVRGATLRRYGAVSSQAAAEMAFGAADLGGADYGIGITGIAGPGGGTPQKPVGLVYVALAKGHSVQVKKLNIGARARETVREVACLNALDMVRRAALGLEIPGTKTFARSQQADMDRVGRPRRRFGGALRAVVALLLVAVLLALLVLGTYYLRPPEANAPPQPAQSTPAAQGLRYGTPEYTAEACRMVADAMQTDGAVAGLVALPDGAVESLVRYAPGDGQETLFADENTPAQNGGVLSHSAVPATPAAQVVLRGGEGFAPLRGLLESPDAGALSTFTYYTQRDARVYRVFAVYTLDTGDAGEDGFDPMAYRLSGYGQYLSFVLGVKARSVVDMDVPLSEHDSFMTLAVPSADAEGRMVYLAGRLLRGGESPEATVRAAEAGSPLMPAAWYAEQGQTVPNAQALYDTWMHWLTAGGQNCGALQLQAGISPRDAVPLTPLGQRPSPETLTVTMNGKVVVGFTLDILAQICQSEGAGMGREAIKALAVAAHSWIRNRQGAGDAAPRVAGRPASPEVADAVRAVQYEVLSADGESPAFTPWFELAAEGTADAETVFGVPRAYLTGALSPLDAELDGWRTILTLSAEELAAIAAPRLGVPLGEDAGTWLGEVLRGEGGTVQTITLGGVTLTGMDFWQRVLVDADGRPLLASPAFEVSYSGASFTFICCGKGHGCGLSLAGADAYARQGWSYDRILEHYYAGAQLMVWE